MALESAVLAEASVHRLSGQPWVDMTKRARAVQVIGLAVEHCSSSQGLSARYSAALAHGPALDAYPIAVLHC